mmetsp:Transcript_12828/g.28493  ORF Transcript_12828/g.28493 Transcript_12828/m.28493 type:complete len:84 (-) Transcript_12828:73-324(-)
MDLQTLIPAQCAKHAREKLSPEKRGRVIPPAGSEVQQRYVNPMASAMSILQLGHFPLFLSHCSRHCAWYTCRHGSLMTLSFTS